MDVDLSMAGIVVRPRARILHGHDWVFSSEVLKVFGDPADGDVISIKDGRDKMLGSAIWNSKSQIVARRFSHRRQELDVDFFKRRITQAVEYRARRRLNPELHRVVWSESDGVPGVILDRYGDQFVLQLTTLGWINAGKYWSMQSKRLCFREISSSAATRRCDARKVYNQLAGCCGARLGNTNSKSVG